MTEEYLRNYLDKYTSRYIDYEIMYNMNQNPHFTVDDMVYDYAPICMQSASFLRNNMAHKEVIESIDVKNTDDINLLIPYLNKGFLIAAYFLSNAQAHEFVIIPIDKNRNYLVQSAGGLLAAHYDVYDDHTLLMLLANVVMGDTFETFHFRDMTDRYERTQYEIVDEWMLEFKIHELKNEFILPIIDEDIITEVRNEQIEQADVMCGYNESMYEIDSDYKSQQEFYEEIM